MASALSLPAASGAITGSGKANEVVNVRGFSLRGVGAAVSVNIREVGASGNILLYLDVPAASCIGDMFPVALTAKAPLYCEFVAGAAAGLGALYVG